MFLRRRLKKMFPKVIDNIDKYKNIFDNVHLFETLKISTPDLYKYFTIKYSDFRYRSDNELTIAETVNFVTEIYNDNFTRKINALTIEYKPLENYDSTETEEITNDLTQKSNTTTNSTTTTNNTTSSSEENISKISPYDSETFNNNTSDTGTISGTGETTTTDENKNDLTNTENGKTSRTMTRHGNIGVTTSQQMLESELNLRKFNIIDDYLKLISDYILISYVF